MNPIARPRYGRRDILKSSALALGPLAIRSPYYELHDQRPTTANGGTDPFSIPWLDKIQMNY
jgi:hypothetical protein